METDRELLEMAAKAAGIEIIGPVESLLPQFEARYKGGFIIRNDIGGDSCWNALGDDGDALRLAVKLRIDVNFGGNWSMPDAVLAGGNEIESCSVDPQSATRRAIVRAAVEIGWGLK